MNYQIEKSNVKMCVLIIISIPITFTKTSVYM